MVACAPEGSSAYVTFNVPPDETCLVQPSPDIFIPSGLFDIGAADAKSDYCKNPYFMNLLINSNLKANARDSTGRAEPNVLQIMEADVRLADKDKQTLPFNKTTNGPALPNPFRVQTANSLQPSTGTEPSMGIVSVEAIPTAYAARLTSYDKVLVEITIYGTTTGNVSIELKPFLFPVSICRGCLTKCLGKVLATEDPYGNKCKDDSAQDGRVCVDPGC
jgi:hypothetical protein